MISVDGAIAADNPFRFSTKYFDGESELYYYGYRYYSAEKGRWINRDPSGLIGGSINIYTFVDCNPLNKFDYIGLAGNVTHGLKKCRHDDDCATLIDKMNKFNASLVERRQEMVPYTKTGQPYRNWLGHVEQIVGHYKAAEKCLKYYNSHKPPCCGEPPSIFNPFPLPYWTPPQDNKSLLEKLGEVTGLAGAALITYAIISEGSRVLFPPRNLVPVP